MGASNAAMEWSIDTGAHLCRIRTTDRRHGDFRVDGPEPDLEQRRAVLATGPWTWLRQVHGATVVEASRPGEYAGAEADGVVTFARGVPIAVTTADCAPVVLVGDRGIAVVHAGWRGAAAGIIAEAADRLRARGAVPVATILGPCIGPATYEFGADDLDVMVARFGPDVAATTSAGAPALDMPAVVGTACRAAGWPAPGRPPCTSDPRYFSHRVRHDAGRATTVAWLETRRSGGGPGAE